MIRALLRSAWRNKDGAAMAEAAIALPVLSIIFAGIVVIGATLYNSQIAETAARDAARYLARLDNPSTNEAAARNLAVYANVAGSGQPRFAGLAPDDVTFAYRTVANPMNAMTGERTYRGPDPITVVTADVRWDSPGAGLWALFGIDAVTYATTHEERVIGD